MINNTKLVEIMEAVANKIEAEKQYLTDLDNPIGDGDHGINMARGFAEVLKKLPTVADKDCGAILKSVGMTLVSTVGGASGPLYGTAFMKAGAVLDQKMEINANEFIAAFKEAIEGIKMRGKAVEGEKTMLDALIPAYNIINEELERGENFKSAFEKGVKAAEDGILYTKTIIATKGRASYLGERSIGHQDPGATSATMILETILVQI